MIRREKAQPEFGADGGVGRIARRPIPNRRRFELVS